MRFASIVLFFMVNTLIMPAYAGTYSRADVSLSSQKMPRGDVILIGINAPGEEAPRVTWMGKDVSLVFDREHTRWHGFLAADLDTEPATYQALVEIPAEGLKESFDIPVVDKDYGVRRLTLPKDKVELDAKTLERVTGESAEVSALWDADVTVPAWDGGFISPVEGDVVGTFGKRSVINNLERSPHTGVDMRGSTGDPVKAVNNGRVVLTADHFFTGNSVFLDHGGGIISMYFHLDRILVSEGDMVEKGQVIGRVGSTGRATGPHLHWGVRVNGARVNPLTFIDISMGLEE